MRGTFEVETTGSWAHIALTSEGHRYPYSLVYSPSDECILEVPGWDQIEHYTNEGYVQLQESGTHTLSIFVGETALDGGTVTGQVRRVDEPPFDPEEPCTLDDEACACTAVCNCEVEGW